MPRPCTPLLVQLPPTRAPHRLFLQFIPPAWGEGANYERTDARAPNLTWPQWLLTALVHVAQKFPAVQHVQLCFVWPPGWGREEQSARCFGIWAPSGCAELDSARWLRQVDMKMQGLSAFEIEAYPGCIQHLYAECDRLDALRSRVEYSYCKYAVPCLPILAPFCTSRPPSSTFCSALLVHLFQRAQIGNWPGDPLTYTPSAVFRKLAPEKRAWGEWVRQGEWLSNLAQFTDIRSDADRMADRLAAALAACKAGGEP